MPAPSECRLTGWWVKAACLGEDPELFFPLGTTGAALEQTREAKRVCADCEVRAQCLGWALATGQDAGIWGGLTEDERRTHRRKQQRGRKALEPPPARNEGIPAGE